MCVRSLSVFLLCEYTPFLTLSLGQHFCHMHRKLQGACRQLCSERSTHMRTYTANYCIQYLIQCFSGVVFTVSCTHLVISRLSLKINTSFLFCLSFMTWQNISLSRIITGYVSTMICWGLRFMVHFSDRQFVWPDVCLSFCLCTAGDRGCWLVTFNIMK